MTTSSRRTEDGLLPKRAILSSQIDLSKFNDTDFAKAPEEEKRQTAVMAESTTFFRDGMRRLRKNPLAMGSIIVLLLILILILVAPLIVPYSYDEILTVNGVRDTTAKNLAPFQHSAMELQYMAQGGTVFPHIFGTDDMSRDYFIRVIYGTRVSLSVGLVASILVLIIGVLYGSIAGYAGGKVDLFMMRIVDIIYSLPDLLIIILLSVVFNETLGGTKLQGTIFENLGSNMLSMFLVFGLLYWVGMARLVRGQILTIIITTALQIPSAIFTESYLSFLGLGVQAPMPSLGSLANAARDGLIVYPTKMLFPSLMIVLIVLSFNLLGDGLRDAFDPKLRK